MAFLLNYCNCLYFSTRKFFLVTTIEHFRICVVLLVQEVFPGGLVVKKPAANAGDLRDAGDIRDAGSVSGLGGSPGGGNGNLLQYSVLAWKIP